MKRAFTLLELLTVVAIMGILGSAAVGGYQAITRGMTEKAALDATANIADLTRLRAKIDRCRTYLFLFTEVLSADTDDEVANVAGLAIAVRGYGRVSAVDGNKWFDEFGDMDQAFRVLEPETGDELTKDDYLAASTQFRLYNLNQKKFAIVRNGVLEEMAEPDLEAFNGNGDRNAPPTVANRESRRFKIFGYEKIGGDATFKPGEEFGREFAAIKLPKGYTFEQGKKEYKDGDVKKGLQFLDCHEFTESSGSWRPKVYRRRPDGTFTELKD